MSKIKPRETPAPMHKCDSKQQIRLLLILAAFYLDFFQRSTILSVLLSNFISENVTQCVVEALHQQDVACVVTSKSLSQYQAYHKSSDKSLQ